jgi:single-strand DNA-binding protein
VVVAIDEGGGLMAVEQEPQGPESFSEVVIVGRLGTKINRRQLPSGDEVDVFTVVVDRPARETRNATASGASVDAIACQSFRAAVMRRLETLSAGEWVRVEGTLRRRFWRAGAGLGSAMEVDVRRLARVRAADRVRT